MQPILIFVVVKAIFKKGQYCKFQVAYWLQHYYFFKKRRLLKKRKRSFTHYVKDPALISFERLFYFVVEVTMVEVVGMIAILLSLRAEIRVQCLQV